jgi:hypothetical protein
MPTIIRLQANITVNGTPMLAATAFMIRRNICTGFCFISGRNVAAPAENVFSRQETVQRLNGCFILSVGGQTFSQRGIGEGIGCEQRGGLGCEEPVDIGWIQLFARCSRGDFSEQACGYQLIGGGAKYAKMVAVH